MKSYCDKCGDHVEIVNVKEITPEEREDLKEATVEENKKLFQGYCPECGKVLIYQSNQLNI